MQMRSGITIRALAGYISVLAYFTSGPCLSQEVSRSWELQSPDPVAPIYRSQTPHGWLVRVGKEVAYIPDPKHTWGKGVAGFTNCVSERGDLVRFHPKAAAHPDPLCVPSINDWWSNDVWIARSSVVSVQPMPDDSSGFSVVATTSGPIIVAGDPSVVAARLGSEGPPESHPLR